jgi:hypothetical protein
MILDKRVSSFDGAMNATFWLEGWLNMPSILKEITSFIAPYKILSLYLKYIHGLRGEETEVHVFAVRVVELEVRNERRKANKEA